ncbi:MAG: GntR family transcriptional regulator [Betaproteobacteria bacterium]
MASTKKAEDRVFNAILDAVLDHRLPPGTKLKERELAEIFGTSRGTVRAALTRLGHSLLVELRPNRGAVIANPSPAETRELFEARRVVEAALVERLAKTLRAKQLAELRAFVAEETRAYERGDAKEGQRRSIRFHKLLSELAGNSTLDRFLETLICRTPLLSLARTGRGAYCGAHEHRDIVEALARHDATAAVRCMSAHLAALEAQLSAGAPAQVPATLAAALAAA